MIAPDASDFADEPRPIVSLVGGALAGRSVAADQGSRSLRLLLVALDFAGTAAGWTAAFILAGDDLWPNHPVRLAAEVLLLAAVTVVVLSGFRLYRARVCASRTVELTRLGQATALCAVGAALLSSTQHFGPPPKVDLVGGTYVFLIIAFLRAGYSSWLKTCRIRGLYCREVCILGANEDAAGLVDLVNDHPELGYRVVSVVGDPKEWVRRGTDIPAVDPGRDVVRTVRRTGASGVLIAASAVSSQNLDQVVRQLVAGGLHVQISSGLGRIDQHRIQPVPMSNQLFFYVEQHKLSTGQALAKRCIDLVVGLFVLLAALPVLAVAALAVKLDDGGPVFYRQERVGRHGETFRLYKLRTMVPNASEQLAELKAQNERNGPLFKLGFDPRVTRVGHFLRSSSIDELPQLFNVLRGEMSLVGPRPALPDEVAQFDHQLTERSSVLPGITGLWQIEARDNPSFGSYRRLDLFYVDNWSVTMDLTIILATAGVVFGRAFGALRGAREMNGSYWGESGPAAQTSDAALASD